MKLLRRRIGLAVAGLALALGSMPARVPAVPLDSQEVLLRYQRALVAMPTPKTMIFTYSVSQAGPHVLEQMHRIYRRGDLVRDEMLATEGQPLRRKPVRIARYPDRYAVARLAPRSADYAFLFQRASRNGGRLAYDYAAVPTQRGGTYVVEGMTIDGQTYLPVSIRFSIASGSVRAHGELHYAKSAAYWVPQLAVVDAQLGKNAARERIAFSGYRFPASLPESTFHAPTALPTPALPTF